MNKNGLPRRIPEDVKLKVRINCGFGCVICGAIPYDYDHLSVSYADAEEHDPDDIVLLCPTHHRLKTNGMLSADVIKVAKGMRAGVNAETRFKLPATSADFDVVWGSTVINSSDNAIVVDGDPILSLRRTENDLEPIVISGEFRDHRGRIICRIEENEFISRAGALGDLSVISNRFSYRLPGGLTGLSFNISDRQLKITEAFHVKDDAHVLVKGDILQAGSVLFAHRYLGGRFAHCQTAIEIGSNFDGFSYDGLDPLRVPHGIFNDCTASYARCGIAIRTFRPAPISTNYDRISW